MIRFDESVLAVWYMVIDEASDWMMTAKHSADQMVELTWRVRYYSAESQDPFDDKDTKNWYVAKGSIEGWQDRVQLITRVLTQHAKGELFELIRGERPLKEFVEDFMRQPFVHVRVLDHDR